MLIIKPIPPVQIRANAVKKELEQTKTLTSKLENKESDIKELRRVVKEKQEQLSEMTIRKELAEKKLGNVNKDYELTIEKLQRKLEEAHNNYKKKEKEFEETLDHLQKDIDSLENEKGEMKEKLKIVSKKAQMEVSMVKSGGTSLLSSGIGVSGGGGSQYTSLQPSSIGGPSLPAVVRDSPLLLQEIDNLRKLFHQERNERIKLQNVELKKKLTSLAPLPTALRPHDPLLDSLIKEGTTLKQDILMTLATPKFPQIYSNNKSSSGIGTGQIAWQKHFAEENHKLLELKRRADEFRSKVAREIVSRKYGGRVEADFTVFPTIEMVKVCTIIIIIILKLVATCRVPVIFPLHGGKPKCIIGHATMNYKLKSKEIPTTVRFRTKISKYFYSNFKVSLK